MAVTLTIFLLSLDLTPNASAGEYKVLYEFDGGAGGRDPQAGLTMDGTGNLYGTTASGGRSAFACSSGCGVVFKLTPNADGGWSEAVLHSFDFSDGAAPEATLIFDAVGNLYGTTNSGGANTYGTVFKLKPKPDGNWRHRVLYNLCSQPYCSDGASPPGGVTLDASGNLYGTGRVGGIDHDFGTAFKLAPNPDGTWTQSVLHTFGGIEGAYPSSGLLLDGSGNLYGTTNEGGAKGYGTAYQLVPQRDGDGTYEVIRTFGRRASLPSGALVFDPTASLYGTTQSGGAYGFGSVFKLTPQPDGSWSKSTLHSFRRPDGAVPAAGVILDTLGSLYGTTYRGGAYDAGTVFKLTPKPDRHWKLTSLHVFKKKQHPAAGLVMDAKGNLYGTTRFGGKGYGVVFEITP